MSDAEGPRSKDDGPEAKPWPKPVRYTLLILLGAVVGVGVVTMLYSRGILPIAGPFVAMFLGPVFVWFGLLWRRRRITRLSRELAAELERLQTQIESERRQAAVVRTTGASDESLDYVADVVRRASQHLAWGQEPEAAQALAEAADRTVREWQSGAKPTAEVRRIAERARPLAKSFRRETDSGR